LPTSAGCPLSLDITRIEAGQSRPGGGAETAPPDGLSQIADTGL